MDQATRTVIEALHAAPGQCVLALTGGGASAAADLLAVPGASRTVLEVIVPYHAEALHEFLGYIPEQACSAATSLRLATRAFERALWLAPDQPVVGLGATASLATDRPKRGDHRFHVSACLDEETRTYSLTLQKGARDRAGEEAVLKDVILGALARAFRIDSGPGLPVLPGEVLEEHAEPGDRLTRWLAGDAPALCIEPDGRQRRLQEVPREQAHALLPGAFNPVHHGHWELRAVAERLLGTAVAFELSVDNVDKPSLGAAEVRRRLAQFAGQATVWLTRAPTFVDKARLFGGAVFVVGADTAERIAAPRYYASGHTGMLEALALVRRQGCRFLVAGRLDRAGAYQGLESVPLPAEFADLFTAIPRTEFQVAISSTEIRTQCSSL